MNFKQKALDKIGLDESQVNEIEPVHFENYYGLGVNRTSGDLSFWPKYFWIKKGADGVFRSNAYQVSWLFFGDKQVYVYQHTMVLSEDNKNERTEEYFYKDITNFSTASTSEEQEARFFKKGCIGGKITVVRTMVETDRFTIIVPGDKFNCALRKDDKTDARVQGMKSKLREKKG